MYDATTNYEREILFALELDRLNTNDIAHRTGKIYVQACRGLNSLEDKGFIGSRLEGQRDKEFYFVEDKYKVPVILTKRFRQGSTISQK